MYIFRRLRGELAENSCFRSNIDEALKQRQKIYIFLRVCVCVQKVDIFFCDGPDGATVGGERERGRNEEQEGYRGRGGRQTTLNTTGSLECTPYCSDLWPC